MLYVSYKKKNTNYVLKAFDMLYVWIFCEI